MEARGKLEAFFSKKAVDDAEIATDANPVADAKAAAAKAVADAKSSTAKASADAKAAVVDPDNKLSGGMIALLSVSVALAIGGGLSFLYFKQPAVL